MLGALVLDALITLVVARQRRVVRAPLGPASVSQVRAAAWTLAGIALAAVVCGLLFVLPNWTEYRFYNWQMSVTRKPEFTVKAFVDRASWIPIIHDFFTRMYSSNVL